MLPTLKPPAAGFKRKAPGSTLDTKQYEAHRPALVEATALAGAFERRFQKADRENLTVKTCFPIVRTPLSYGH
jgi:hypothetical protein